MEILAGDLTNLAKFHPDSFLQDDDDAREIFGGKRTMEDWDKLMKHILPDLKIKKRKYRHTPKWFKKKMLQELSVTLEHLKNQERNILKNVVCECY